MHMKHSVSLRKENLNQSNLNYLLKSLVKKQDILGAVFCVESGDKAIRLISAAGNIKEESPYYIASINKLFISAVILKLSVENRLNLKDPVSKYLSEEVMSGLHVFKGIDYSHDITITHLMSHTSGLPCYLIDKKPDGKRVMDELLAGMDQAWPIERVIKVVKTMKPNFPPGKRGKAKYVDTNHQLLSKIIENITGVPITGVLKNLFRDLNLAKTFVCENNGGMNINFIPAYYKSEQRRLPVFLNSTGNEIISTANDQMKFIRAFFGGCFFPKQRFKELETWNNIFFPFKYGIGIEKFYLPRVLSPFSPVSNMIGHCGSTGSVAFYVPEKDIFITGTVNQLSRPGIAFKSMIKIVNFCRS